MADLMRVLDLKCESKLLWDIKNLIRKATDELFDINRTAKEQDYIAIAELRGRLTQRFPDIFEDPSLRVAVRHKRMQAAMDYVSRSYTWKRVKHRTDMKEEEERNDDRDSLQIRSSGRAHRLPGPTSLPTPATSCKVIARDPLPPPAQTATSISQRGAPPKPKTVVVKVPKKNRSGRTHNLRPHPSTRVTSPGLPPESRADEIEAFLRNCVPNMKYLLDSFIGFGCCNNDFLVAAARWPEPDIDSFLNVVCGAHSSDMVRLVLKRHLQSFSIAKSEEELVVLPA